MASNSIIPRACAHVTQHGTISPLNNRSLVELRAQVRARLLLSVTHIRELIVLEDM